MSQRQEGAVGRHTRHRKIESLNLLALVDLTSLHMYLVDEKLGIQENLAISNWGKINLLYLRKKQTVTIYQHSIKHIKASYIAPEPFLRAP